MKPIVRWMLLGLLLTAAVDFLASCKRYEEKTASTSSSDAKKIQEMLKRRERGIQLEDLPEKYHKREQRSTKGGELFDIYVDGEFVKRVRTDEFSCEHLLLHQKGTKIKESCPLLPFLLAQTDKKIVQIELAGELQDYTYHHFDLAELDNERVELVAFVNRGGRLRVEERPTRSFLTEEEAAKGGKALRKEGRKRTGRGAGEGGADGEGKGGGTGEGTGGEKQTSAAGARGMMRGRFKTRALLWADLYTHPVTPASARATNEPDEAVPEASKFSIQMPGGETKWITTGAVMSCGDTGCDLSQALPESFEGTWCVSAADGLMKIPHAELARRRIKTRPRDGELVLEDPTRDQAPIRAPLKIEPCP